MQRSALTSVVVMKYNSKGEKKDQTACENHLAVPFVVFAKIPVISGDCAESIRGVVCVLHSCCQAC